MLLKRNSPLKRGDIKLKKTSLKKISALGKQKRLEKNILLDEDKEFYLEIWNERLHSCYETKMYLGEEPLITMFHHVLCKELYPQFRHCKWNIVLLLPSIHNQVETNIASCPKVLKLTQELLTKLKNNELSN